MFSTCADLHQTPISLSINLSSLLLKSRLVCKGLHLTTVSWEVAHKKPSLPNFLQAAFGLHVKGEKKVT